MSIDNTISIMKQALEHEVKDAVYEQMLKEFLAKAESEFASIVKPKLRGITFDRLKRLQEINSIRESVHVFINGVEETKVEG